MAAHRVRGGVGTHVDTSPLRSSERPCLTHTANGSDKKALENAERATPGFLQNTVSALPRGDDGAAAANVSGDGGRKWESLMRHAYDNVKVRSARGSEDGV